MNALAFKEIDTSVSQLHGLVALTDEMHFDAAFNGIVEGVVLKIVQIKIGVGAVVEMREYVEIKRSCYPLVIVIGSMQHLG
tara:strand:+ start:35048 stop:35290 length:243 start_codon:yes stop_codon:yes gene_type:complete